ncbi:MAG: SEC-C metal-binding domain-containing protein, partial [Pseudomonadota bacterium]
RNHENEAGIIADAGCLGAVTIATNMAGGGTDIQLGGNAQMRLESYFKKHDRIEPAVEQQMIDDIAKEKAKVLKAGGLYVVGTQRHESRRIDNQLRGRSGRQGDPGASKFFISLEDDLMRIFGSERMEGMLSKLGLEDGEAIVHPWVSKALEKAQQKVEARNFDLRKQLLKYDDVMNDQRAAIFSQRRELMQGQDIEETVLEMREEAIQLTVERWIKEDQMPESWDLQGLKNDIVQTFNLNLPVEEWAKEEGVAENEIRVRIETAFDQYMKNKTERFGVKNMRDIERDLLLRILDHHWKEHLLNLDHLRQGIGLRAYAQRDPLNEYKQEAFSLFESMLGGMRVSLTRFLAHIELQPNEQTEQSDQSPSHKKILQPPQSENTTTKAKNTFAKVGRNDPCPCGSGKKYKHCHGRL